MLKSIKDIHHSFYPQIARDIASFGGHQTQDDLEMWLILQGSSMSSYESWITFQILINTVDDFIAPFGVYDSSMFDNLNAIG